MANGGKRPGAGRKKTLKSELIGALRDRMTDADFDMALDTLRYAMKAKGRNLKSALSAAQFIVEQKIGKAPQPITGDSNNPVEVVIRTVS